MIVIIIVIIVIILVTVLIIIGIILVVGGTQEVKSRLQNDLVRIMSPCCVGCERLEG